MSLQALLTELRSEPLEAARLRAEQEFDRIASPFANRIVIFGTGHLGDLACSGLRAAGVQPIAFCDNNSRLWGSHKDGVEVMSPAQAAGRYKDSAVFVGAIYNSTPPRRQLQALECRRIVPYPVLFWKYWQFMPKEDRMELPHRILERAHEMAAGYELLSDDRSRTEFCAQIRWRCLLDYNCLPQADDTREMYFPSDLVALLPAEAFVDCGAFDGDSVRAFVAATGGRFGRIYAWEADPGNVCKLTASCGQLTDDLAERIQILPYAVGERNVTMRFTAEGSVSSRFGESDAAHEVDCKTIDAVFSAASPTFIKMDIEGAEPAALRGAMQTMARCRPVMAVCAYHSCDHLWTIPQLLKGGNPDYHIFLRRYAEDCWETVYYAVPPERLRFLQSGQAGRVA